MNTIDPMTQTKKRENQPSRSSSSEPTEPSKTPKDVLALGRQIVSELGLEPGVDTLSKWMAHHIAELISDAEPQTDPEVKRNKEAQAAVSISKLWQHRSNTITASTRWMISSRSCK